MFQQHQLDRLEAVVVRTSARVDLLLKLVALLIHEEKDISMSIQDELARLNADITKNSDAVASATAALTTYASSTADLTAQLKAALDAANINEPTVKAAADALEQQSSALLAAVPQVAAAVVSGTAADTSATSGASAPASA